jgi:hypothetical protein
MKSLFSSKLGATFVVLSLIAAFTAGPATASAATSCSSAVLSQPFASFGDSNYYAAPEGESYDAFGGEGWKLSGGAEVVSTTLADGAVSTVLDLPAGAQAVSPALCVNGEYPSARSMINSTAGSQGVTAFIGYEGTPSWNVPRNIGNMTGLLSGWSPSNILNTRIILPKGGSVQARFTLQNNGGSGAQIYNFYVDPRMSR